MNTLKIFTLFLFLPLLKMHGQEALEFSLEEAKVYALDHNKTIMNAKLDQELAKKSVWEAISTGLPQVSAVLDYTYFFDYEFAFNLGGAAMTPEQVAGFESQLSTNGGDRVLWEQLLKPQYTAEPQAITLGSQAGAKLQVSQLVFSGQYLVGVQSARLAKTLVEMNYNKTAVDVIELVTSSYYVTLISESSVQILKDNLDNLNKTLLQTQAMVDAGVLEQLDVDQLKITQAQLKNSLKTMERNLMLNYNMIRFQLGLDPGTIVKLSSSLDDLVSKEDAVESALRDFVLANNLDYKLFEGQEKIQEKMVDLEKSARFPTISAFYAYNSKIITTDFDLNAPHTLGVNLSVPIFTSWNLKTKIKKAEIELDKVRNTKAMLEDQLQMQSDQLKYNLKTALENYDLQKENVKVAKRVYESYGRKHNEGIISSLDLTQANSSYLEAESNYLQSVMSLLQAQLALDKLNNTL